MEYIYFERENWTVIGRYNDGGRKELQEFHRKKHFVIRSNAMENTRTILSKVTSSYSRHSMAKWRVPRLIYPTELELHRENLF